MSCLFDRRAHLCNENNFHLTPIDFQINSASDDNISDLIGDIVTCGYTGIVSVDKRESIIRYSILTFLVFIMAREYCTTICDLIWNFFLQSYVVKPLLNVTKL